MVSTDADRVVVLTGANEGIGHHMAATLAGDGYRVAGLDVNVENLRPLRDQYPDRVRYHECDVRSDDDVEAAVDAVLDEWERVDILVNNAAVLQFGFFENQTVADMQEVFDVNCFGYVRTIHAVLPHMLERDEGKIHNVSSGVGLVGNPGLTAYGASKGAIEALTKSLRLELRNTGVSCSVMHPRLANTRSAATLDYDESMMSDPADVGRKLARKVESTKPVVMTDWVTRIGLALARRFPVLVRRETERFVREHESGREPETMAPEQDT
ncbi:SDR family NAD(P)-dependent oxidoreductase [Haloarchaeobius litoreus]|uniref:SDR family NAD(P)-dependent oxidoreductase n=1 Tax=Haloarchaeobius litoreus TaxID=755306 RepID=A0ABD6DIV7_9EURY|nr:SDR family NAD(P)-dependent oxidoreductase [Haloarchaeobius litoreus]